jgi:hypothetical protein
MAKISTLLPTGGGLNIIDWDCSRVINKTDPVFRLDKAVNLGTTGSSLVLGAAAINTPLVADFNTSKAFGGIGFAIGPNLYASVASPKVGIIGFYDSRYTPATALEDFIANKFRFGGISAYISQHPTVEGATIISKISYVDKALTASATDDLTHFNMIMNPDDDILISIDSHRQTFNFFNLTTTQQQSINLFVLDTLSADLYTPFTFFSSPQSTVDSIVSFDFAGIDMPLSGMNSQDFQLESYEDATPPSFNAGDFANITAGGPQGPNFYNQGDLLEVVQTGPLILRNLTSAEKLTLNLFFIPPETPAVTVPVYGDLDYTNSNLIENSPSQPLRVGVAGIVDTSHENSYIKTSYKYPNGFMSFNIGALPTPEESQNFFLMAVDKATTDLDILNYINDGTIPSTSFVAFKAFYDSGWVTSCQFGNQGLATDSFTIDGMNAQLNHSTPSPHDVFFGISPGKQFFGAMAINATEGLAYNDRTFSGTSSITLQSITTPHDSSYHGKLVAAKGTSGFSLLKDSTYPYTGFTGQQYSFTGSPDDSMFYCIPDDSYAAIISQTFKSTGSHFSSIPTFDITPTITPSVDTQTPVYYFTGVGSDPSPYVDIGDSNHFTLPGGIAPVAPFIVGNSGGPHPQLPLNGVNRQVPSELDVYTIAVTLLAGWDNVNYDVDPVNGGFRIGYYHNHNTNPNDAGSGGASADSDYINNFIGLVINHFAGTIHYRAGLKSPLINTGVAVPSSGTVTVVVTLNAYNKTFSASVNSTDILVDQPFWPIYSNSGTDTYDTWVSPICAVLNNTMGTADFTFDVSSSSPWHSDVAVPFNTWPSGVTWLSEFTLPAGETAGTINGKLYRVTHTDSLLSVSYGTIPRLKNDDLLYFVSNGSTVHAIPIFDTNDIASAKAFYGKSLAVTATTRSNYQANMPSIIDIRDIWNHGGSFITSAKTLALGDIPVFYPDRDVKFVIGFHTDFTQSPSQVFQFDVKFDFDENILQIFDIYDVEGNIITSDSMTPERIAFFQKLVAYNNTTANAIPAWDGTIDAEDGSSFISAAPTASSSEFISTGDRVVVQNKKVVNTSNTLKRLNIKPTETVTVPASFDTFINSTVIKPIASKVYPTS